MPPIVRDRQQAVLNTLVRLFIERREPVSSRMIEEAEDLGIRSASIRNVLHELELEGYLSKPHASSGRVPTDAGYRAYVDALRLEDDEVEARAREDVTRAIHEAGADLEQLLRGITRALGQCSQNIAILAGPREKSPRVVGVDLHQRDSRHLFVVISLEGGAARTELVRLDREVVPESVHAAATVLGERLCGRTLDEIRLELDGLLEPVDSTADEVAAGVAQSARDLFDPSSLLQFTYEGVEEALHQPEFADAERLKALLEVMAHADEFESALERSLRQSQGDVALRIGSENELPQLKAFSLLATRFELDDRVGYFAVLGPRRMRYAQTVTLVRLIARHLEKLSL